MSVLLEVCCGDIASVGAARSAGAARIELCSALTEGGLTPTPAMTCMAVDAGGPAVNVLIRPRSGDFLYSADEVAQMEAAATHGWCRSWPRLPLPPGPTA